jgi:outer membrane autotransporter protein
VAVSLLAATGAQAQNCTGTPLSLSGGIIGNFAQIASPLSVVAPSLVGNIVAVNTAFLTQSTAFVGAPGNPQPDQQGGGVWVRGVAGELDSKDNSTSSLNATLTNTTGLTAAQIAAGTATNQPVNCNTTIHADFDGVQLGTDISKLNVNGWNLHLGTTAGYIGTRDNLVGTTYTGTPVAPGPFPGGPFNSSVHAPFAGAYVAATHGGFFTDALLRFDDYQMNLNSPSINLYGQNSDAHSVSVSASVGYNYQIPNSNWFVEPSAGFIWSRTTVDPLNLTGAYAGTAASPFTIPGTLTINDITTDIGRLGLRVGETVESGNMIWQPFAAVSVWHDFAGAPTASFTTCPGCVVTNFSGGPSGVPTVDTAFWTGQNVGTFGQYSVGISGQVVNTGWVGFARLDYRDGANLVGLSGTGGVRYQFTPGAAPRGVMPVKAPLLKAPPPVVEAVNWTGFYIGGFGGAILGTADWDYIVGSAKPHIGGYDWGGDIGYNYQNGQWVVGVEGDLSGTNLGGGTGCGGLVLGGPMFLMNCNTSSTWIATATARLGYAWDRSLWYVKGGGAWSNERATATCNSLGSLSTAFPCTNPAGFLSPGFSASTNRTGWTVGYGSDFALTPNWSARAETDYISFGDSSVTASDGSALKVGMHLWETKIGLNYRFNVGPVVARY